MRSDSETRSRSYGVRLGRGVWGAAALMALGGLVLLCFPKGVLGLFDASPELLSMGGRAMRIISVSYIFTAYMLIAQGVYQALGNGVYSLAVTLLLRRICSRRLGVPRSA